MVERYPDKIEVRGSIPRSPTKSPFDKLRTPNHSKTMLKDKPVTEKRLITVLADFWEKVAWPVLDKRFQEERQLNHGNFRDIKRQLSEIKTDLADTPTRQEFAELNQRVNHHLASH